MPRTPRRQNNVVARTQPVRRRRRGAPAPAPAPVAPAQLVAPPLNAPAPANPPPVQAPPPMIAPAPPANAPMIAPAPAVAPPQVAPAANIQLPMAPPVNAPPAAAPPAMAPNDNAPVLPAMAPSGNAPAPAGMAPNGIAPAPPAMAPNNNAQAPPAMAPNDNAQAPPAMAPPAMAPAANAPAPPNAPSVAGDGGLLQMSKQELTELLSKNAAAVAEKTVQDLMQKGLIQGSGEGLSSDGITGLMDNAPVPNSAGSLLDMQTKAFTAALLPGENLSMTKVDSSVPTPTYAGGVALDMHVTAALRTKIWNNEYVNLADLLVKDKERLNASVKLSKDGQFVLEQAPRKLYTIEKWNEAFSIYAAVYSKKYPEQMSYVIKHMTMVRKVFDKGGDWLEYDRQYRRYRQEYNTPWSHFNSEIYTDAVNRSSYFGKKQGYMAAGENKAFGGKAQFQGSKKPSKRDALHPVGYCWSFLDGQDCKCDKNSPGAFKHQCSICDKKHSLAQCPRAPKGNFRPSAAAGKPANPSEN